MYLSLILLETGGCLHFFSVCSGPAGFLSITSSWRNTSQSHLTCSCLDRLFSMPAWPSCRASRYHRLGPVSSADPQFSPPQGFLLGLLLCLGDACPPVASEERGLRTHVFESLGWFGNHFPSEFWNLYSMAFWLPVFLWKSPKSLWHLILCLTSLSLEAP